MLSFQTSDVSLMRAAIDALKAIWSNAAPSRARISVLNQS